MSEIPNTEYITINKDGIFVGGKPATTYMEWPILFTNNIKEMFAEVKNKYPEMTDLQICASSTTGHFAKTGYPSVCVGPNVWCRTKFCDGHWGAWVFVLNYFSNHDCFGGCAYRCLYEISLGTPVLCSAVFGKVSRKKESDLKQILKKANLSKYVGKKVELNGYVITVQKQR